MKKNFKNKGNAIYFTDTYCGGNNNTMIHYSQDVNSSLFDIINIELKSETKVVKWLFGIGKKKVKEYYIELSYKLNSWQKDTNTKIIAILPTELNDANQVVSYISGLLEKRKQHLETLRIAKEQRNIARREEELKRLANCEYDVVVIDFETTGIKSPMDGEKYDEILSVSIVDQDGNTLLNTLCKPQKRKTWTKAQEIHGISPAMVKNQPTFEEVFPTVKEILYKAKVVIAYNISFEMKFLWGFDLEFGKPGGTQLIRNVVWGPDPMLMYSAYKGVERWQKLTSAAKHFKFDFSAHDSLEDVRATLHCYNKLLEYIKENPEKDYVLKSGFLYDDGKKGKWFNYETYTIQDGADFDYKDVYETK